MDEITSDPRERLKAWLKWKGWSTREAGRQFGCDPSYVSKILTGARRPGLELAHAISEATVGWDHGAIEAAAWIAAPTHRTGTEG